MTAAFGARDDHVTVPALEVSEAHPDTVARLRATLVRDVWAVTTMMLFTAVLVRAASTI